MPAECQMGGIGWYRRQTKQSRKLESSEKEKAGGQAKNEKHEGKQSREEKGGDPQKNFCQTRHPCRQ
jgi:hypothetical protein